MIYIFKNYLKRTIDCQKKNKDKIKVDKIVKVQ